MSDLTFVIVHYNTPELTSCLLSSLRKHHPSARVIMIDNSNKRPFNDYELFSLEYYDNTKQQLINFEKLKAACRKHMSAHEINAHDNPAVKSDNDWGSMKHASTVQWFIDTFNIPFILLDSDILLKTDVSCYWNEDYVASGEIFNDRLLPFLCFINAPALEQKHIKFFRTETFNATYIHRDTGGTFLSELKNAKEPIQQFKVNEFCEHFGNGSWRLFKGPIGIPGFRGDYKDFLMLNMHLWR